MYKIADQIIYTVYKHSSIKWSWNYLYKM